MAARLVQLIHKYWDCFYSAGVSRPILGLQFRVDTGSAQPYCCRQPRYGVTESRIMDEHIQALLSKQWIQQQTVDSTVEPRCLGFYDCPGP